MSGPRPPRVVAELGRPETPAETAERKARDRALRRSRQTARNLIASLAVCVGLVVVIVLLVPRGAEVVRPPVDVARAAAANTPTAGRPLLAPDVPAAWSANAAELRGSGADASWYVGWVAGGAGYAGLTEGLPGSDRLVAAVLDESRATGTTRIGGLSWQVHDRRRLGQGAGNVAYGLATRIGAARVAVYGTVPAAEVRRLAAAVAADAAAKGLADVAAAP